MTGRSALRGHRRSGVVMVVAMIFILIFSALAVSMATMANTNAQLAHNQHTVNSALLAAQSGLEMAKYVANTVTLASTGSNAVSGTEADQVWTTLRQYLVTLALDSRTVPASSRLATGNGDQVTISGMSLGQTSGTFSLRFYRYDANRTTILIDSTGADGPVTRKISMDMAVTKDNLVLNYAVASKSRTWLTGDTTVHGNMYSAWKYQSISPFHMTSDSTVDGTLNTILTNINPTTGTAGPDLYAGTTKMPYHLETLDASGHPEYDSHGNKVISSTDEIQGQCQGINYAVSYGDKAANMPGMNLADYDTSTYKSQTTAPADSTIYNGTKNKSGTWSATKVTEYMPHADGNYTQPAPSGGLALSRYVCQSKTLTNAMVVANRNALFKNCTFNGILYVDGGSSTSSSNNVRFENCVFNGPIVTKPATDTSSGWWQRTQLYFTGTATFQNQTTVPATILAPNFNVDIGNTDPTLSDNNVLTGAIIGGIVDIRGNAQVYGTIISMFDTSSYPSGYVSNIGATLGDGGSETTDPGDVGVITITPDPAEMLPSGITTPIVIKPDLTSYAEGV